MEEEFDTFEQEEKVIEPTTLISWSQQEGEKLLNIVKNALDLDKHKVQLPDMKEPIPFLQFINTYKNHIRYGESVVANADDSFIEVVEDIKIQLRTIVRERLIDGFRKLQEVIRQQQLLNDNLKNELRKKNSEVEKMTKDIENIEVLKEQNTKLKEFGKIAYKNIEDELNYCLETIKRKIDRLSKELNIEIEEEQQKVM
mgnify:CR=1 FL=1